MTRRLVLRGLFLVFLVGAAAAIIGHRASRVATEGVVRTSKSWTPIVSADELDDRWVGSIVRIFGHVTPDVWESIERDKVRFDLDAEGTPVRIVNWQYLLTSRLPKWPETNPSVVVTGRVLERPSGGPPALEAVSVGRYDRETFLTSLAKPFVSDRPLPTYANYLGRRVRTAGLVMMGLVVVAAIGVALQGRGAGRVRAAA